MYLVAPSLYRLGFWVWGLSVDRILFHCRNLEEQHTAHAARHISRPSLGPPSSSMMGLTVPILGRLPRGFLKSHGVSLFFASRPKA
jgi:hypothetical protein